MTSRLLIPTPWLSLVLAGGAFLNAGGSLAEPSPQAQRLAREALIVDTHIDVPYRLHGKPEDISKRTASGDFDYPRARAGGLDAAFMSIYVPAEREGNGAKALAEELIDLVEGLARAAPEKFALARSPADIRSRAGTDVISLPMGMENGAPIEGQLANVGYFYERGIRYIGLAHGTSNHLADSSFDIRRPWQGLSPFGREVIAEMNRLGIMVDVSHLSDEATAQAIELSRVPVIASHSSARAFMPGFERNLSDALIRAIAARGGVVQVNFGSAFLIPEATEHLNKMRAALQGWRATAGKDASPEEIRAFVADYNQQHSSPRATIDHVIEHIDHIVELVGIDYVGLGSDFDGVGDTLPEGLRDVSQYPNLIDALLTAGYSEPDVKKILGENLLRVWAEVERQALSAGRQAVGSGCRL